MKSILILTVAALSLSACVASDTYVAQREARITDKPAHVTCTGYASGVMVDTDTTGRIEWEEGRLTFVDAKTGQLTISEGECIIRYHR